MTNYETYIKLMNDTDKLHTWVKTLTRGEKLVLIETLDRNEIPVLRSLAYDYETQQWVV